MTEVVLMHLHDWLIILEFIVQTFHNMLLCFAFCGITVDNTKAIVRCHKSSQLVYRGLQLLWLAHRMYTLTQLVLQVTRHQCRSVWMIMKTVWQLPETEVKTIYTLIWNLWFKQKYTMGEGEILKIWAVFWGWFRKNKHYVWLVEASSGAEG